MTGDKPDLFAALDSAREYLWAVVDLLHPAVEIYPGWKKCEFLAHIAGYEALIFDIFRDYLAGVPFKDYPYNNLRDTDAANGGFVAARQSSTVPDSKLECEINRFAIKKLLADVPDADFHRPITFPWGEETISHWALDTVTHERDHADEILAMQREGKL